jgi:tetratricopeptide (TPR) repeat protein
MKLSLLVICSLAVLAGVSCSRDPQVVARRYVENGNRYFDGGKYKEARLMYKNAIKRLPTYSEAYYRAGMAELRLGLLAEAARDLRRAGDTDANNVDARAQLAELYLSGYLSHSVGWKTLRADIEGLRDDLLKKNPKSIPGLRIQGVLALSDQKLPEAIQYFEQANQISPLRQDIVLPLAQALALNNRPAEGEKLIRDLIAKDKTIGAAYDFLYLLYARANRLPEAEEILKLKLASNPKSVNAAFELARHYYALKKRPEMDAVLGKIVANTRDFPDGHGRVARFYAFIQDPEASMREYDKAIAQEPKRKSEYQTDMAAIMIGQRKRPEAARLLDQVLKADPKNTRAQEMRAALQLETGNPQEIQAAINSLQAAVGQDARNPVLRFSLGRALWAKGQPDQARTQFQEAVRLQPNYVQARLALAELNLGRGDANAALQDANEALKMDERNLPAKLIRSAALVRVGNLAQARADLDQTVKDFPQSRDAVLQMAGLDLAEKKYKDAESIYTKLRDTAPAGDLRASVGLSETYAQAGQFDKAIQVLKAESDKRPDIVALHTAIGNIAYRAESYDLAIQQFQTVLKSAPDSGDTYVRLAQAYRMKGDMPTAVGYYQKARELRPNDANAHLQFALALDAVGQKTQAKPVYDQVLKLEPDNPVALNNVAYMIAETGGDLDQALAMAQRAKQKLPNSVDVADTLGWIYIKKNLSDNAIDIFRDLVGKDPGRSTFHYHLGMALFQKGDKPEARRELQAALQRKPSRDEESKIKELLAKAS